MTERDAELVAYVRYLHGALWWAAMEMDDCADAIGPAPDLAEQVLRSISKRLLDASKGNRPDLGPFGPPPPKSHAVGRDD